MPNCLVSPLTKIYASMPNNQDNYYVCNHVCLPTDTISTRAVVPFDFKFKSALPS